MTGRNADFPGASDVFEGCSTEAPDQLGSNPNTFSVTLWECFSHLAAHENHLWGFQKYQSTSASKDANFNQPRLEAWPQTCLGSPGDSTV